jgi:hypothetical protein
VITSAHSYRGQTLANSERRHQQGLSLGQRRGLVVVIMMTALVGAEFPVVPLVTICD